MKHQTPICSYNKELPNFCIVYADDQSLVTGTNQVMQAAHWTWLDSPYNRVSYIYARNYNHFVSNSQCIYISDITDTDYMCIQLKAIKNDLTGTKPSPAFTFAPGVTYNLIFGRTKDSFNS